MDYRSGVMVSRGHPIAYALEDPRKRNYFPHGVMFQQPAHICSSNIKSTANYVWSILDVLGQGATGLVYRGRHKQSGAEHAVKVFKTPVGKREFEVLRMVNHTNIVRLHDVEEESISKQCVLIMELCSGGSLHTMLDDPENLYGLPEDEFKRVVSDITAGMKHLHDKGIVHRDLKPGNVMRVIGVDGRAIYKLTDFGAARELDDNEEFTSLYGTEEYLHPDMYQCAVLQKSRGKTFSATVDLWSMGVMFYHIATGQLPFRPYGGARKNREAMYQLTSAKPSGVISGVQQSEYGKIEWSVKLPKTCRLSQGFQKLFTPILAGILECDPHKVWTFEHYFSEVEDLLSKVVIDIFSVPSSTLYKIYISAGKTLAPFQENISQLTDIRSRDQLMLHDGVQLEIEAFMPVKDYPPTSPENPIIIVSTEVTEPHAVTIPYTCKPPTVKIALSLENDSNLAKVCSSTLFDIRKSVQCVLLVQSSIRLAVKWFISYLKKRSMKIQLVRCDLEARVKSLKTSLETFEEHYRRETTLLEVVSMTISQLPEINELKLFFTRITERMKYVRQIRTDFYEINEQCKTLDRSINQDEIPSSVFVDEGSRHEDRLVKKMIHFSEKSREIFKLFKKQKHNPKLTYYDKLQHEFEKRHLAKLCDESVVLFTNQGIPPCKRLHKESMSWFRNMNAYLKQMEKAEVGMGELGLACNEQEKAVKSLQRTYRDKLSTIESVLTKAVIRPSQSFSAFLPPTSSIEDKQPKTSWVSKPHSLEYDSTNTIRYKELREGLQEAKMSIHEVRNEVKNSSGLLQKMGLLTWNPNEDNTSGTSIRADVTSQRSSESYASSEFANRPKQAL